MDESKHRCDEINPLSDIIGLGLSAEEKEKPQTLLHNHQAVFAAHDKDYGRPGRLLLPGRERCRLIPPKMYQEVKILIRGTVYRYSRYISLRLALVLRLLTIVLVCKKDGAPRFCADYHKLSSVTHKDAYPLASRTHWQVWAKQRACPHWIWHVDTGTWKLPRQTGKFACLMHPQLFKN